MDATLKDRFFETVYEHFKSRKCSLRRIIKTEYSFEEWFNCETILACSDDRFAAVGPRPFYDRCGAVACKSYGDILVEDGPEKLLVEIGMAHDGTYGKQLYKLENDRKKLSQPLSPDIVPIQVVVCMSRGDVRSDPKWMEWLNRLSFWFQPTCFDRLLDIDPGTAHFRAWIVPRNDNAPSHGGPANATSEPPHVEPRS